MTNTDWTISIKLSKITNMTKFLFSFILMLTFNSRLLAQETSAEKSLYLNGIKSYQDKKYQEAFTSFESALKIAPNNEYVLYNYGLSSLKLKKKGLALGAWRRAMHISPGFSPAKKAIEHALKDQNNRGQEANFWEDYRKGVLGNFKITTALLFQALLLLITGFYFISFFAKRKKAFEEDLELPSLPKVAYAFALLLLLVHVNFLAKIYSNSHARGTIITSSQALYSSPDIESSVLLQLSEGDETVIQKTSKEWSLVKFPNSLMGWVPTNTIFKSSGKNIW